MQWTPVLSRQMEDGRLVELCLGHRLVDEYLAFAGARVRKNSWLAIAYDLKVFFSVVAKDPVEVAVADVLAFLAEQRRPRGGEGIRRIEDGERGLSARTLRRRLSSVSGFFDYLVIREIVDRNPVPKGPGARNRRDPRRHVPLIRTPRTLPRVLLPAEVDRFVTALRTERDRSMVLAMLLGGLRRCEVLGLRMADVHAGERKLFVADGKGGHQRLVPVSVQVFDALARYFASERPDTQSDRVFVVLKGPRRGQPLSAAGLDEIVDGARRRAGIVHLTCHQLRHTCLTRLREAGMPLEAVQAQAGHRSMESTRIYLHLTNDWLAGEYLAALRSIESDQTALAKEAAG